MNCLAVGRFLQQCLSQVTEILWVSEHSADVPRTITAFSYTDHISRNGQLVRWLFNDPVSGGDVTVPNGLEDY